MDETLWGLANILGPLILLGLLLWLVLRSRRSRTGDDRIATDTSERTERSTQALYDEEEARRRDGTDGL